MYIKSFNSIIGKGIKALSERQGLHPYNLLDKLKLENTEGPLWLPQIIQVMRGSRELQPKQFQEVCRALDTTGIDIFLTGLSELKRKDLTTHEKEVVDIAIAIARKLILNEKELKRLKNLTKEDLSSDRFTEEEKEEVIIMKECAIQLAEVMKKFEKEKA
jgi:hypothetical protein